MVVARPVQRFFKISDLGVIPDTGEGWLKVVAITKKVDREMIVGLVVNGAVELRPRGAWVGRAGSVCNSVCKQCQGCVSWYQRFISVVAARQSSTLGGRTG